MSGTGHVSVRLAFLLFAGLCVAANAQEPSVQPLLKEGDSAFAQGNYAAAQQAFEKAFEAAQRLPEDSPVRYEVLKRLTSNSAASGKFADAQRYLQQAMKARVGSNGVKNDPKIEGDLLLSVNLDMRTKDFDRAMATAERLHAMHVTTYATESLPVADDFLRIGQIYLADKKPHEAVRPLLAALAIRTRLAGSFDAGLLPALDRLNDAFVAIGGAGGNEPVLRQALVIRETLYGENSPELISNLEGLANACSAGGEYDAAEAFCTRLLTIWEGLVGEDHPMVAVTLDKLVVFYIKEGAPEKARDALARSVGIRARFLAVGLSHQAADDIAENQREQAQALYQRALAALGPATPANEDLIAQLRKALDDLQALPGK